MKCQRCQKDVPVLTPSVDGDQDVCENCYAQEFHARMARRVLPKGAIAGAIAAAVALVAIVAYLLLSGPPEEPAPAPAPDAAGLAVKGPNKPASGAAKPKPKKPRQPATPPKTVQPPVTPPTEPSPEEPAPEEKEPGGEPTEGTAPEGPPKADENGEKTEPIEPKADAAPRTIEAQGFSLSFSSGRRLTTATVSLRGPEAAGTAEIPSEEGHVLFEVSLLLRPKADGERQDEIVLSGLGLAASNADFQPIQARAFEHPYLAPSAEVRELAADARIVVRLGAESSAAQLVEAGQFIAELVVSRTDRPASAPLTLLFLLPENFDPEARLFLGDHELPVLLEKR